MVDRGRRQETAETELRQGRKCLRPVLAVEILYLPTHRVT